MTTTDAGTISVAVVILTQVVKGAGLPKSWAPVAVFVLSLMGVGAWAYSHGGIDQAEVFDYFTGWAIIVAASAGVFGIVRTGHDTLMQFKGIDAEATLRAIRALQNPQALRELSDDELKKVAAAGDTDAVRAALRQKGVA